MSATSKKYKHNEKPRLSANQLAEYSTATPARRTAIITDAKYPKTAVVPRYGDLRTALKRHLTDPAQSHHILSNAVLGFQEKEDDPSYSTWVKEDCRASIEAITKFQRSANTLGLAKYKFVPLSKKFPPVLMEGVKVSITPDVLVKHKTGKGNGIGGAILVFSKSEKSPEKRKNRGKVAALLMLMGLQRFKDTLGTPDPKLCMVIDVYEGKVYDAASGIKRLSTGLEHSCREIARAWDDVEPPSDYAKIA